ncbi:MAG TPA: hypothetical protein VLT45_00245 [Kofleriaceae bacterium]|nr:hypothetical protein [Kofleriaceae bacterium]
MRLVVFAWLACSGCDALFHLDHVPLPGDGTSGSDATLGDGAGGTNLVFVSSQTVVPASLGGAAGADALCTSLATRAGHPGTYVAWLGTSTKSAPLRIGTTARGWVRADGRPFADTVVDIVQGNVWYPLRLTETGEDVGAGSAADLTVVTGTNADGTTGSTTCGDFTTATIQGVSAGLADNAPYGWSSNMGAACTSSVRLYCFGVDRVEPVSLTPESTRRAFITLDAYPIGGGIAALDQACAVDATSFHLTGTFKAAVATTTQSALSRFAPGAPWVRPDGVTAIDSSGSIVTPIELDGGGGNEQVGVAWAGAPSLIAKSPTSAASCYDWTRADGTLGLTGNYSRSAGEAFGGIPNTCNNMMHVYCLQD